MKSLLGLSTTLINRIVQLPIIRHSRLLHRTLSHRRQSDDLNLCLDLPGVDSLSSVENPLVISGWAFSSTSSIERVTVKTGTGEEYAVIHGLERPDVASVYRDAPEAGESGFYTTLDITDWSPGLHTLTVTAVDEAGNTKSETRRVKIKKQSREEAMTNEGAGKPQEALPSFHESATVGTEEDLDSFFDEAQQRIGREPSILDWYTGIQLVKRHPHRSIFSPPGKTADKELPYLEDSIDVVVCSSNAESTLQEAMRVATVAVLSGRSDNPNDTNCQFEIHWLGNGEGGEGLPSYSIIIPVYNNLRYTKQCLEQLRATLPQIHEGEIIVVDDCSTDETERVLRTLASDWGELHVVNNKTNQGFLRSCNLGASVAKGEYLVFLNNDTLPQQGWLSPLFEIFRRFGDAGAVGGKLIYPDGSLQEAGGIIFSDGSGWNFGKHDPITDHPLYSHVREVDYCSGALLVTRRELFNELGGFDMRFVPAYYEDTDYCFQIRKHGLKVYYQPESVVVHFEGTSSGTDINAGVKKHQVLNKTKFVKKWHDTLEKQPPPPTSMNMRSRYQHVVRSIAN